MIPVVVLLELLPGLSTRPSWLSLLIAGPLALAVFTGILLLVGLNRSAKAGRRCAGLILTLRQASRQRRIRASTVIMGANGRWSLCERPENRTEKRRAPDTDSYRESHLGAEKARSYDEDLWDSTTAKGLDWLVEQRLLAHILATQVPPEARSAADFACGTGRVLEFLSRRFPSRWESTSRPTCWRWPVTAARRPV